MQTRGQVLWVPVHCSLWWEHSYHPEIPNWVTKQKKRKAWPAGRVGRLAGKHSVCSRCLQPRAAWEPREVQEPRLQVCGIGVDAEPGPTSAKAKVKLGCAGNCLLSSASGNLCLKLHFA